MKFQVNSRDIFSLNILKVLVTEAFLSVHSVENSWQYLAQLLKVKTVCESWQIWRQKSSTDLIDRYRMSNRHFFAFLFNVLQIKQMGFPFFSSSMYLLTFLFLVWSWKLLISLNCLTKLKPAKLFCEKLKLAWVVMPLSHSLLYLHNFARCWDSTINVSHYQKKANNYQVAADTVSTENCVL